MITISFVPNNGGDSIYLLWSAIASFLSLSFIISPTFATSFPAKTSYISAPSASSTFYPIILVLYIYIFNIW